MLTQELWSNFWINEREVKGTLQINQFANLTEFDPRRVAVNVIVVLAANKVSNPGLFWITGGGLQGEQTIMQYRFLKGDAFDGTPIGWQKYFSIYSHPGMVKHKLEIFNPGPDEIAYSCNEFFYAGPPCCLDDCGVNPKNIGG